VTKNLVEYELSINARMQCGCELRGFKSTVYICSSSHPLTPSNTTLCIHICSHPKQMAQTDRVTHKLWNRLGLNWYSLNQQNESIKCQKIQRKIFLVFPKVALRHLVCRSWNISWRVFLFTCVLIAGRAEMGQKTI
jgi:hypothetical protein